MRTVLVIAVVGAVLATSGCRTIRDIGYIQATNADKAGDYEEAARLYAFVAKSEDYDGRAAAQFRLAEMYFEGLGVQQSQVTALRMWEDVAKSPDKTWRVHALYRLAALSEEGVPDLLERDRIRAAGYYKQGAELGDKYSRQGYERLLGYPDVFVSVHGDEFTDKSGAVAPAGIAFAMEKFKNGNYGEAFPIFLWHARHGNAAAQRVVGIFYRSGLSVDIDHVRHAAWTYLSARNGNRKAQLELGLLYRQSEHIKGTDDDAEMWFQSAARQGVTDAINELGILYLHPFDRGRNADPTKAFQQFKEAAALGSINAMANLGDLYLEGTGVPIDREKAKELYLAAAEGGSVAARRRLFEEFQIAFDAKTVTAPSSVESPSGQSGPEAAEKGASATPKPRIPPVVFEKDSKKSLVDLYAQLSPSVIKVFAIDSKSEAAPISQGSAVAISDKLAVTNCHVLAGYDAYGAKIGSEIVVFTSARRDEERDICVIYSKFPLRGVEKTRSYRNLKIGEKVYAIGSPKGLQNTLSEGIVSGLREIDGVRYIQTSAAISSGSSGGGLFDEYGQLIGITTFKVRGGENLNFAIAVDEAMSLLAN